MLSKFKNKTANDAPADNRHSPSDRTEKFAGALARILRSAAKALDLKVIE